MTDHRRFPIHARFTGVLLIVCSLATGSLSRLAYAETRAVRDQLASPVSREQQSLRLIEKSSNAHVRKGFELANRGALFTAQAEFVKALKLIGRARDELNPKAGHYEAVVTGLTAMQEADDFERSENTHSGRQDIVRTIAAHRTAVLKNRDPATFTVVSATRIYCAYGQSRLLAGCGKLRSASAALYGLGRIEISLTRQPNSDHRLGSPKAMALFETALRMDPQNYKAANELGVLLNRYGQHKTAIRFLHQSVQVKPSVEGWHNLSVAFAALGEDQLADHARTQAESIRNRFGSQHPVARAAGVDLRWVDQATFVAESPTDTFALSGKQPALTSEPLPAAQDESNSVTTNDQKSSPPQPIARPSKLGRVTSGLKSIFR